MKSNTIKRCPTFLKFFQVLWKHNWPYSYTRMPLKFIGSCKIEMITFILSIWRNWKLKDILKVKLSPKQETNLRVFVSLWMERITILQLIDTLREDKWLTMTLWSTRLPFFMTILLGLMYQCLNMIEQPFNKFLINSQILQRIYKKLLRIKRIMRSMKTSLVMLSQVTI